MMDAKNIAEGGGPGGGRLPLARDAAAAAKAGAGVQLRQGRHYSRDWGLGAEVGQEVILVDDGGAAVAATVVVAVVVAE